MGHNWLNSPAQYSDPVTREVYVISFYDIVGYLYEVI